MGSLNTFIKDVRAAKTLAEERSIITKESAKIRTKLKDDHLSLSKRRKNIHKLLYLYVLGEKTHFAQVECINLIASESFEDKRLGYLAAMLLLDSNQELLTLLTNLLSSDLRNSSKYIVSAALGTFGALASPALARDLYLDVENILKTSREPYILKKALQCAAKIVSTGDDYVGTFYPYVSAILTKSDLCTHGVLFGVNKLIQEILNVTNLQELTDYDLIARSIASVVPGILALLKSLNEATFTPEFDAHGMCDPFLQVEMLHSLCAIFTRFPKEASSYVERLHSLLSDIATRMQLGSNSSNAVLYEVVRTIFVLDTKRPLRVQAVNLLAKLLSSNDMNTKYIALNTLARVVAVEPQAVQGHRKFISQCLFDPDVSIQKRSLELMFTIMEDSNMKDTVDELIKFLSNCDGEDRDHIIYTVEHLINKFGIREVRDEKWKLSTMIRILCIVGEYLTAEIIGDILIMLNNVSDQAGKKQIACQILKLTLGKDKIDISEENSGWKLITVWTIGEYAELILDTVTCTALTKYLCNLDSINSDDYKLIGYILTAALKLSGKCKDAASIEKLRRLINSHTNDTDLLLQSKAVHYSILFNQPQHVKAKFLEKMPVFVKVQQNTTPGNEQNKSSSPSSAKPAESDLLGDLLSDIPSDNTNMRKPEVRPQNSAAVLSDLFSNTSLSSRENNKPVSTQKPVVSPFQNQQPLSPVKVVHIPDRAIKMHSSSAVNIFGEIVSSKPGEANIQLYYKAQKTISRLVILAAVSKTQKLTLGSLSNVDLAPGSVSKQLLNVTGTGILKLRIKLDSSNNVKEQFDYKFDTTL
ncbi:HDL264Cp [Eremothecium sinecaudum]|uniref:AP-1 complex subunit gamma n=1 Tax=Eremothecium sinecaudum TaxID=45286 RepID=A0A0X8HS79_9SACH|nr:HDL264Cp [Eremothecium sinecaudum]AMD20480.1 HDL264Cp [Eremothecium sinecaudum]